MRFAGSAPRVSDQSLHLLVDSELPNEFLRSQLAVLDVLAWANVREDG